MSEYNWNDVHKNQPTNDLCEKEIEVTIVAKRCVYLNDHRIAGSKPYVSEVLPSHIIELNVREALEAFSVEELQAYISEKKEREEYYTKHRKLSAAE